MDCCLAEFQISEYIESFLWLECWLNMCFFLRIDFLINAIERILNYFSHNNMKGIL